MSCCRSSCTSSRAHYAAAKDRESALDFEDLQLRARDLLRDDDALREREQLRFRSIMVDEFQDTNRLQCELVDLLTGDGTERFFVGDEFQSIYGFRHADVEVFRERRAGAETLLPLTRNYRSRPEVLSVVNRLFGAEFGEDFQPLAASGEFPDPVFGTPVELLVTDKSAYAGSGVHWRRAEARNVARRVKELVDSGAARAGEIVLLFAAGTDAEWYEEELRGVGLADLPRHRPRLLRPAAGRRPALVPAAAPEPLRRRGARERARVAVRRRLQRRAAADPAQRARADLHRARAVAARPTWTRTTRGCCARSGSATTASPRRRRDCRSSGSASASSPTTTTTSPSSPSGTAGAATRTCASSRAWRGRTRSCEARTSRASSTSSRSRRRSARAERDAVAEEEDADAVRLLTIHAAKGLEFKVVVVADAGRDRNAPSADEILCLADGRFGFRVADPITGKRHGVLDYDSVKEARAAEDEAERLRLYYVAMTRAIDRLIVSGSIDSDRKADERTPIGWVLGRLDCAAELANGGEAPVELEREGARVLVRVDRTPPPAAAPVVELPAAVVDDETGQLALFAAGAEPKLPPLAPALAPIQALPDPPLHDVRRLSYSALALFERCSYRYYAERVAGMRPARAHGTVAGQTGLVATEIGDAVHRLLELVELAAPAAARHRTGTRVVPGGHRRGACADRGRSSTPIAAPSWRARIATLAGARPERPFAFEHDGVLLHGRLDVLHRRRLARARRSTTRRTRSPRERRTRSSRPTTGSSGSSTHSRASAPARRRSRSCTTSSSGRTPSSRRRSCAADVPELEAELSEAIARIRAGSFVPTPSEFTCAGCPALDVVCAGPRLRGGPTRTPALAAVPG